MSEKTLIIKIGAIGDIILLLPLLAKLKNSGHYITLLTGSNMRPLIEKTGLIDSAIYINEKHLYSKLLIHPILAISKSLISLLPYQFSNIIIAHRDIRFKAISWLIRGKIRTWVGYRSADGRANPVPGRHHSDEYIRLYSCYQSDQPNTVADYKLPALPLTDAIRQRLPHKEWIAIAPGGAKNAKSDDYLRRWPIEKYVELCEILLSKGISIVLTGSKSDSWVLPFFNRIPAVNLIGETTINELIAIYQHSDLVITHDSGPIHLAGLAGAKRIGLFGPTLAMEKIRPSARTIAIQGGQSMACSPCYDGVRYSPTCKKPACLDSIGVESVAEIAIRLLDEK